MAEWMETYRGVVNAWECDTVEHFTIAYYFERFASATRTLFELIGEDKILGPTVATNPRRIYTTFLQELRAGAGFHMLSGVIGVDEGAVRLGNQVVDSASARTVSWVMEKAAGVRREREDVTFRPCPLVFGSWPAVALLDRHDWRIHAPKPPRLLDPGARPET